MKICLAQKEVYEEDQFLGLDHHEDQMKEANTRESDVL